MYQACGKGIDYGWSYQAYAKGTVWSYQACGKGINYGWSYQACGKGTMGGPISCIRHVVKALIMGGAIRHVVKALWVDLSLVSGMW